MAINFQSPVEELKVSSKDREDSQRIQDEPQVEGIELDPLAGPEGGKESNRLAKFWQDQIKAVDDMQQKWFRRGKSILKRYRDERNRSEEDGGRRFNSLWCNVQILQPNLYAREPQPIVERRFKDKDPTGRAAAQMLERCLRNNMEISGFNGSVDQGVNDYLLPGRGSAWVRYEPQFGPGISIPVENSVDMSDSDGDIEGNEFEDESPSETKLDETGDRIIRESAPVDYVSWQDFYIFPAKARIWKEVTAVGKRCFLTRDQLKERFGNEIGKALPLSQNDKRKNSGEETSQFYDEDARKGEVFEIWDRTTESVYWVAEGYSYLCDRKDDPLQLENFFPTPAPINANATQSSMIPVPDYVQYQDQAIQIDELTQRLAMLTKACKVVGVYNARAKDIQRLMQEGVDNELIPVDDWAAFADKGGVAGQTSFLPLKEIIGTINELTGVRQRIMGDMDRLTGITDIMRGTTDARETMGGQRLKTNSSSTRLIKRQAEIARFCKDIIKIQADIICKHVSPQSLIEMSGAMYDEGLGQDQTPVSLEQAEPLLREAFPDLPLGAGQGLPPLPQGSPGMPPGPASASSPIVSPVGAAMPPNAVPPGAAPPQGLAGIGNPAINGVNPAPQNQGGAQVPGAAPPEMSGAAPPLPPGMPPQGPGPAVASAPPQQQITNLPVPVQQPQPITVPRGIVRIASAINLLRNERLRGFRIDIETDSTIVGDLQQDKQEAIEFLKVIGGYMQQGVQLVQMVPEAAPVVAALALSTVRRFRPSRDLEVKFEDFADAMEKKAQNLINNPQAQPPNPAQLKLQSEQMKMQQSQQQGQRELQQTQIETQGEFQRQQLENQGDIREAQVMQQSQQMEVQIKQMEMRNDALKLEVEKIRANNEARKIELENRQLEHEMSKPPVNPMAKNGPRPSVQ